MHSSLYDLILHELRDLYDTTHRLRDTLERFTQQATAPEVRHALRDYVSLTEKQIFRLKTTFLLLGSQPEKTTSIGLQAILEESEEAVRNARNDTERDRALTLAARRTKRYAIANYGAASTFATMIHRKDVAFLLWQAFDEEEQTEQMLLDI